jgi:hypothetical protein
VYQQTRLTFDIFVKSMLDIRLELWLKCACFLSAVDICLYYSGACVKGSFLKISEFFFPTLLTARLFRSAASDSACLWYGKQIDIID